MWRFRSLCSQIFVGDKKFIFVAGRYSTNDENEAKLLKKVRGVELISAPPQIHNRKHPTPSRKYKNDTSIAD